MKIKLQIVAGVLSICALGGFEPGARAQNVHEDLSACSGSAPEPNQSTTWAVAFCNRTGHDLVPPLAAGVERGRRASHSRISARGGCRPHRSDAD